MKVIEIVGENCFGSWDENRTACRGIVMDGDRILLSYETKTDQWMIPGGGLEGDECEEDCCVREVAEETGVLVKTSDCLLEIDEYYENCKYVNRYFMCRAAGTTGRKLTERETEAGMEPRWLPVSEIMDVFAEHASYEGRDEMRRGMYLREYTALTEVARQMRAAADKCAFATAWRKRMYIETERLIITEFTPDMAETVHENSLDEDNRRFVPDEVFETVEDAQETLEFLISQYGSFEGPLVYPVIVKETQDNVGYVQLCPVGEGMWEVGYHIAAGFTGNGYATEAVKAFLPVIAGEAGITEIYGICLADNKASEAVMKKCGFENVFRGTGQYQGADREIVRNVWRAS